MFTPESLLAIAAEAEARYQALLAEHPPGTINQERNDAYDLAEKALVCAEWLERSGRGSLAYVGPFGTLPFGRGSRVRIRKGAIIRSTKPGTPREGVPAKTTHVVTVHDIHCGFASTWGSLGEEKVRQPAVNWAGDGGYWRWVDANDVEVVS